MEHPSAQPSVGAVCASTEWALSWQDSHPWGSGTPTHSCRLLLLAPAHGFSPPGGDSLRQNGWPGGLAGWCWVHPGRERQGLLLWAAALCCWAGDLSEPAGQKGHWLDVWLEQGGAAHHGFSLFKNPAMALGRNASSRVAHTAAPVPAAAVALGVPVPGIPCSICCVPADSAERRAGQIRSQQ